MVKAQNYSAPSSGGTAAPSSAGSVGGSKRPWAISVSVREEFDDNINTSKTNREAAFKTLINPSFLIEYPMDQTLFSARYTYGLTIYDDRQDSRFDQNHEFVGRINHSFSSRFNIDLRERLNYSNEPQLGEGFSLSRRNGDFINNTATIQGNFQWTPKFGTVTAYSNDYLHYFDRNVNLGQERMVHNVSNDLNFQILPTTTLIFGTIYRYQDYFKVAQDSHSITQTVGVSHTIKPEWAPGTIVLGARAGATYSIFVPRGDNLSPYGNLSADIELGARSSLQFNYTHYVTGTDVTNAYLQESDEISIGGRYAITPRLTARGRFNYTLGNYESSLVSSGTSSFQENILVGDVGLSYTYNRYLDFELGYIATWVDSDISNREYDRNRVYIGIRGTY